MLSLYFRCGVPLNICRNSLRQSGLAPPAIGGFTAWLEQFPRKREKIDGFKFLSEEGCDAFSTAANEAFGLGQCARVAADRRSRGPQRRIGSSAPIVFLRLEHTHDAELRRTLDLLLLRMPRLRGREIRLEFRPALTDHRGRLLSEGSVGTPIHAATHIRKRYMVLDAELKTRKNEMARIVVHEIFHFAWLRLGNEKRRAYEQLVSREIQNGARGELGWSAESRKRELTLRDRRYRTRRWREYCCESFCDTGAWLYSGVRRHDEFTLALRRRNARSVWFETAGMGASTTISI